MTTNSFENSGSDDLLDFVDPSFQTGRITVKTPFIDAAAYTPYIVTMKRRLAEVLGEDIDFTFTGLLPVMSQTISAVIDAKKSPTNPPSARLKGAHFRLAIPVSSRSPGHRTGPVASWAPSLRQRGR